jgi:hypothetical protein
MGHNPRMDLCPKSMKKMKKKMEKWVFGKKWGKKGKNGLMGGQRWVEWPEKGRRWDEGWLGGDGWQ